MEPGLQALLKTHAALLEYDAALDKVRCIQSGHTMPAVVRAVEQFVRCVATEQVHPWRCCLVWHATHLAGSALTCCDNVARPVGKSSWRCAKSWLCETR